ncbi:hypothetical protein P171DRAFT_34087 [Karstenula rhodostoma CBS 690.94]|uniref:Uncharacterized protein n=1 Tax=Karstenula rhodostoma CBS 690.94 TaxID=1392251 RepID=A0A9P4UBU8_9PLEO|nr:hypothetical protein P171DRAFT_34087 [Karstenula rhodostoma CBS 690.94]
MEATKAPRTSGAPRRRNAAATPQATNSRPPRMKGILLEMAVLALWVYFIVCTRPQRIADVSTPKLDESEVAMPARQMDIVAAALEPIIDYQGTASERVSQTYQAQHIIDTRVLPSMYQLRADSQPSPPRCGRHGFRRPRHQEHLPEED